MKFYCLLIFILIILFSNRLMATEDTLSIPSWKIYLHGTLQLIPVVKPTEGRFYSNDWYETEEPHSYTGGFQFGLNTAARISKKTYLLSGTEISRFKFGYFRLTQAPDLRYSNPNATYYDTSYTDYSQTILQIPLCIQFPVISNYEYFFWQFGIINDFTFSESYDIHCKQSGNGAVEYTSIPVTKKGIAYTATRLHASIGYDSAKNRMIVMFASGITTGPVIKNPEKENFLSYSFSFFLRMGVGYSF